MEEDDRTEDSRRSRSGTTAVPSLSALLTAIDQDMEQDDRTENSRRTFFELGRVKRGEWSSSDEEETHETKNGSGDAVPPVPRRQIQTAQISDEEENHLENAQELPLTEEDRPGRFILTAVTAMQARQKRKDEVREMTKQRFADA